MSEINTGGAAFPRPYVATMVAGQLVQGAEQSGMTLRDWFAGQALAGMFACGPGSHLSFSEASETAYHYADAMLAAREVA